MTDMRVNVIPNKDSAVLFGELDVGKVFRFVRGSDYYVKTNLEKGHNAIKLSSYGSTWTIEKDSQVVLPKSVQINIEEWS